MCWMEINFWEWRTILICRRFSSKQTNKLKMKCKNSWSTKWRMKGRKMRRRRRQYKCRMSQNNPNILSKTMNLIFEQKHSDFMILLF